MSEETIDEIVSCPDLIIERYYDNVHRRACQIAGADKADDVVQNVFMRYLNHWKTLKTEEHVKAWLMKVTYNCAVSELKNTWTQRTTGIPENEDRYEEFAFEDPQITDGGDDTVYRAVQSLPDKYKTIIHLHFYKDYSEIEIANITGLNYATVRTQLRRGLKRLEKILGKEIYST